MWDAHLELFLLTLTGAVTEDTFDDQLMLISDLRAFFLKIDLTECKRRQQYEPTGIIQLDDAVENLRRFFPEKNPEFFKKISDTLAGCVDMRIQGPHGGGRRGRPIEYEKLFATSNLGTQGDFIEEVRDQHLREVRESSLRLEVEIAKHVGGHTKLARQAAKRKKEKQDVSTENHPQEAERGHQGEIMVLTLRNIMSEIDPAAPPDVIDAYLAHGLGIDKKDSVGHSCGSGFVFAANAHVIVPSISVLGAKGKNQVGALEESAEAEQKELRKSGKAFRGSLN